MTHPLPPDRQTISDFTISALLCQVPRPLSGSIVRYIHMASIWACSTPRRSRNPRGGLRNKGSKIRWLLSALRASEGHFRAVAKLHLIDFDCQNQLGGVYTHTIPIIAGSHCYVKWSDPFQARLC